MSVELQTIVEILKQKGFVTTVHNFKKNNVDTCGLMLENDDFIKPVVYPEAIIKYAKNNGKDLDFIVESIIKLYTNKTNKKFDIDVFKNKEKFLKNIYIGLKREGHDDFIKRNSGIERLEEYIFISAPANKDSNYFASLNPMILLKADITLEEVWDNAEKNTCDATILKSIEELVLLAKLEQFCQVPDTVAFILTNKFCYKGAGAIINKKRLEQFANDYNTDSILVIPSSIHELILLPYGNMYDLDDVTQTVKEANQEFIDESDRLSDEPFILKF